MINRIGNYILKDMNGVIVVQSPTMLNFPELVHYFTTRKISDKTLQKELNEMNLAISNEDFPKYFEIFAKATNIEPKRCIFSHQVHSKNVKVVTSKDIGTPYWKRTLKDTDGLITDEPGIFLITSYADCMPILAYDPVKKVIGSAHSGWRGTLSEIGKELILKMNSEFGCDPQDIFVTVGPSIGPDSFEVKEDVAEEFFLKFGRDVIIQKDGKIFIDLWKALEITMKNVCVQHIEFSMIDTFKSTEYFYSYRKEQTKKRFLSIIGLLS